MGRYRATTIFQQYVYYHDNGDLLADSHNILCRWKNFFSQLLNVYNISDVRQIEVYTAEP
jgi:hypothetical protein